MCQHSTERNLEALGIEKGGYFSPEQVDCVVHSVQKRIQLDKEFSSHQTPRPASAGTPYGAFRGSLQTPRSIELTRSKIDSIFDMRPSISPLQVSSELLIIRILEVESLQPKFGCRMQEGPVDEVKRVTVHAQLEMTWNGSKGCETILVPNEIFKRIFSVRFIEQKRSRRRRVELNGLHVGYMKSLDMVRLDIEKYTQEQKNFYRTGLLRVAQNCCKPYFHSRANISLQTKWTDDFDVKFLLENCFMDKFEGSIVRLCDI